jgi:hypothetical protein
MVIGQLNDFSQKLFWLDLLWLVPSSAILHPMLFAVAVITKDIVLRKGSSVNLASSTIGSAFQRTIRQLIAMVRGSFVVLAAMIEPVVSGFCRLQIKQLL